MSPETNANTLTRRPAQATQPSIRIGLDEERQSGFAPVNVTKPSHPLLHQCENKCVPAWAYRGRYRHPPLQRLARPNVTREQSPRRFSTKDLLAVEPTGRGRNSVFSLDIALGRPHTLRSIRDPDFDTRRLARS